MKSADLGKLTSATNGWHWKLSAIFDSRHDGAMGVDLVELVLRTEEVFSVDLPDEECEGIQTVGDLYRLILDKLKLPYLPSCEIEAQSLSMGRASTRTMRLSPWTTPYVWLMLQAVVHDQLGSKASRITESATFLDDLGCE